MNIPLMVDHARQYISEEALDAIVRIGPIRRWALKRGERQLHEYYVENNADRFPERVQRLRYQILSNLLNAFDHAFSEGRISSSAWRGLVRVFVGQVVAGEDERMRPFRERFGYDPPSFLTISPTQQCNLCCTGCYAASSAKNRATLSHDILARVLRDKRDEWGSHFTVISGGEPFLYSSGGRDLFDVMREFPDIYFMIYTNGTLIDDALAARIAAAGNISPAISVEGWERETDARRGRGVFHRIEKAMHSLRKHGVVFGVSMTATRENAEALLSDEYVDFLFRDQGAVYGWVFQYMPIGRRYTVDLMVTPDQRLWMLERELEMIERKKLFIVDFWNGGVLSAGCLAAGRSGGYFHIDWNGNVSPCVFFPYHIDNVYDIYRENRSLSSVLESPVFKTLRAWQHSYQGKEPAQKMKNMFIPCPMRDHYSFARDLIQRSGAQPVNEEAALAIQDAEYGERMEEYDQRLSRLFDPVWEKAIVNSEKDKT